MYDIYINNTIVSNDNLLDIIKINDVEYYFENKEEGSIYDMNSKVIGVYKNNTIEKKLGGNYLKINLSSKSKNTNVIGAKALLYASSGKYMLEHYPIHGFQSSMQIPLHFTYPDPKVDSVKIIWPNKTETLIKSNIKNNSLLNIEEEKELKYLK